MVSLIPPTAGAAGRSNFRGKSPVPQLSAGSHRRMRLDDRPQQCAAVLLWRSVYPGLGWRIAIRYHQIECRDVPKINELLSGVGQIFGVVTRWRIREEALLESSIARLGVSGSD